MNEADADPLDEEEGGGLPCHGAREDRVLNVPETGTRTNEAADTFEEPSYETAELSIGEEGSQRCCHNMALLAAPQDAWNHME